VVGEGRQSGVLRAGTGLALVSAAAFGSSGPMAKALLEAGWTAGAVVLVRLGGAAIILAVAAAVTLRGRPLPGRAALRTLVLYGVVAMAGVQLAFFNAVRTLDVGVALMIEYLAPVLLLAWTALRARALPQRQTLAGAALAVGGLALVLDLRGGVALDLAGVAWALVAAVCLAAFFAVPPVLMAAGGTAIGAVVIGLAGVVGVVPLRFTAAATVLAGAEVSWVVPAAWLGLVATVAAYLTGIAAIRRMGARSASFVALTEVLFAVLVAWALLAELPGPVQLVGGAAIVAGIVLVRREDRLPVVVEPEPLPVELPA
jgi:drug/metabolite transporter (DMT)-like permease